MSAMSLKDDLHTQIPNITNSIESSVSLYFQQRGPRIWAAPKTMTTRTSPAKMLPCLGHFAPYPAPTFSSTSHPLRDLAKIPGDDIPVTRRLEIVLLQRAVFGRARDEGGLQSLFLRGLEVAVMGGDHHHLLRR